GDRERTEARAALLRQLAFEPEPALQDRVFQAPTFGSIEPAFGATADRSAPPTRRLMAVAVVIVFMAVGAASVYGIYKPTTKTVGADGTDGTGGIGGIGGIANDGKPLRRGEGAPLELLSLSHRTEADDFVVAGLVQNPSDGKAAPSVMAVVYVFNAQGEYFASGKAALEFAPLAPGAESPFVVRLPKTSGVSRFRVGFRTRDGSVVAHVDHRGKAIEGTRGGNTPNNLPQSGGL
ncbi:MAG: hypothetical protein ABIP90_12365, partial [Vicinamibacterales bacterium]